MTVASDILAFLRDQLGEGHEADTYAKASKAYIAQQARPHLIALKKGKLDRSTAEAARVAAEAKLKEEQEALARIEATVPPQVDRELEGWV